MWAESRQYTGELQLHLHFNLGMCLQQQTHFWPSVQRLIMHIHQCTSALLSVVLFIIPGIFCIMSLCTVRLPTWDKKKKRNRIHVSKHADVKRMCGALWMQMNSLRIPWKRDHPEWCTQQSIAHTKKQNNVSKEVKPNHKWTLEMHSSLRQGWNERSESRPHLVPFVCTSMCIGWAYSVYTCN